MTIKNVPGYYLPINERRLDNIRQDFESDSCENIIPGRKFTLHDYSVLDMVNSVLEYEGTARDAYVYSLPTNVKNELKLPIKCLTKAEKETLFSRRRAIGRLCVGLLANNGFKKHGKDIWINPTSETISHFVGIENIGNSINVSFWYSFTWCFTDLERVCSSDHIPALKEIHNRYFTIPIRNGRPTEYLSFISANKITRLIPCDNTNEMTSITDDISGLLLEVAFPFIKRYRNIFDIYEAYRSSLANADAWGIPSHINLAYCYILQKRYELAIELINQFKSILKMSRPPLPFVNSQNTRGLRKSLLFFCDIILEGLYRLNKSSK